MSALAHRDFVKMNGLGNEIVVVDLRPSGEPISAQEARAAAQPAGAPFDQLMVLYPPRRADTAAFIAIYNNDGSRAGACGNGMRCVAALEAESTGRDAMAFETDAGVLECRRDPATGLFTVDMGIPRFGWRDIPLSWPVDDTSAVSLGGPLLRHASLVSMGNPHAVLFVDDVAAIDLPVLGPALEHDPLFPERANITVAQVAAPDHIVMRTWERGAGLTLACGSAACATAVAGARLGRTGRRVRLTLPGGDLVVEWRAADDHVLMTGPVAFERRGRFDPALFAATPA